MKKITIAITILLLLSSAFTPAAGQSKPKTAAEIFTMPLAQGISLSMTVTSFDPSAHKITKCNILDREGICLVDGKPVFGTNGELPKKQLTRAVLRIENASVNLDISCMYNPWADKPRAEDFSIDKTEGGYLVSGSFSSGAGSYEAEWFIIRNVSVRTRLVK